MSDEERAELKLDGVRVYAGRGLCSRCYYRVRFGSGQPWTPGWLLVDEYNHRADPTRSRRANCQIIGPEIGVKPATLERALLRAQRRSV